jgi:hypothetical protein
VDLEGNANGRVLCVFVRREKTSKVANYCMNQFLTKGEIEICYDENDGETSRSKT